MSSCQYCKSSHSQGEICGLDPNSYDYVDPKDEQIQALESKNKELVDTINNHNKELESECKLRERCEAFTSRGRKCPDCPKHHLITPPKGE